MNKEPVSLGNARIVRHTEKALNVEVYDLGRTLWIPKSVIHDDSEVYSEKDNIEGELIVYGWFAEKEQLA